ncbi:MAG: nitroreductase family protein [Tissierellia bacterium]|nr:nitroreductase family protein [Tissierellia bacterium]
MDLKELVLSRRTVRKFTDEEMAPETLVDLIMYASMGPSKSNSHPVEFILVKDREVLDAFSKLTRFSTSYLAQVPQALVVIGDKYVGDHWIEEASITASYLGLLLEAEGWTSAWVNVRDLDEKDGEKPEDKVKDLLNIPDHYGVLSIMPFGKQDERVRKRKPFDASEKLHLANYSKKSDK